MAFQIFENSYSVQWGADSAPHMDLEIHDSHVPGKHVLASPQVRRVHRAMNCLPWLHTDGTMPFQGVCEICKIASSHVKNMSVWP